MRCSFFVLIFSALLVASCQQSNMDCTLSGDVTCNVALGTILYDTLRASNRNPRFLFVSNNGSNTISRYYIQRDGTLVHRGDTATPGPPWDLTVHPNGKYLYIAGDVTATTNNTVTVYTIDSTTGDLNQIANVFHGDAGVQRGPWDVLVHPNGLYMYSSNSDEGVGNTLSTFDLSGGVPVFRTTTATGNLQPAGLALSPDQNFIYSGLVSGSAGVATFAIQGNGEAIFQSSTASCAAASTNIYDVALNPKGTTLYSGSGGGVNGCAYRVSTPGTVTANASYTHNANFRSGMKFSTRGDTLFIANDNAEILTYVIDNVSGLISGSGATVSTGAPNGRDIVVDQTGRFVYALNDNGSVLAYRTDSSGGFIESLIQTLNTGTTPRYAAIAYYDEE